MAKTKSRPLLNGVGPHPKRQRIDSPSSSIDEQEQLDFLRDLDEEAAMATAAVDIANMDTSVSTATPSSTASSVARKSWKRPPTPVINPSSVPLVFQQIDIDYYTGSPIPGMPGTRTGPVPIIRMFGVTQSGNSVCAHIHGFLPYFYIPAPRGFCEEHCDVFCKTLNDAVVGDLCGNRDNVQEAVLAIEMCKKSSIYGFYFNEMSDFLRITVALPKLVAPVRHLVSCISVPPFGQIDYQVRESSIIQGLSY